MQANLFNLIIILKRFFKSISLFFNLIAILGLLFSYLSLIISPASWWVPAFFGLAYPYFLFINILFILFWLFAKTRWAFLSLIAITIGYTHLANYFQLSGRETDEKGIVICSYNVKNFYGNANTKRSETAASILEYLQSKKADIICLQEVHFTGQNSINRKRKKNKLPDTSHLKYIHFSKQGGPVSYSSYPIINKEEVHFPNSGNMIIVSDIKIKMDTIRLFNCHLESYRFSNSDINSLDSISFDKQEESYEKMKYAGSKLKHAFIKRTEQAETLHQLIKNAPFPVIVCGDFNDTPISYTYHTVSQGLEDAFVNSGKGIGNTYLGKLPSFRIDYIFHSSNYGSYNFHVDRINYSDHYPINCVLLKND